MPEKQYGCLFCRTGQEQELAALIEKMNPGVRAIVPAKLRNRRVAGRLIQETVSLFPGYVFLEMDENFSTREITSRLQYAYYMVRTLDEDWKLYGEDRELVKGFFEQGGVVGFSRAYYVGDRIRIAEGFLKDYEGKIEKVNRRAQTAQIRLEFRGKIFLMWLGFELMEGGREEQN